jgi:hypothetical protein
VVTYLGYSDWDKVISQSILEKRSNENKIVLALYGEDINFYDSFTFEWQFVDYHTNSSLSKFAPDNSLIPSKLVDMGVLLTNPIYNSNKVKHTNYIFSISSTTIRPITPLEKELIE